MVDLSDMGWVCPAFCAGTGSLYMCFPLVATAKKVPQKGAFREDEV